MSLAGARMNALMALDAALNARMIEIDRRLPEPLIFGRARWRRIHARVVAWIETDIARIRRAVIMADDMNALIAALEGQPGPQEAAIKALAAVEDLPRAEARRV